MSFPRLNFRAAVIVALGVSVGCDDPLALPAPIDGNFVDTLTLHALRGTPISAPSGYNMALRLPARTDRGTEPFDFAFDLDSVLNPLIFTTGSLGLTAASAVQFSDRVFADIREAPLDGYIRDSAVVVGIDSIFIIRSAPTSFGCAFFLGAIPRYGKFRVLSIDVDNRLISLEALVNINCGYRGLEPGIPTR